MTPKEDQESLESFKIPKGKSGYIIGPNASNLNRIIAHSGAKVQISGRKNRPCQAIIIGTEKQRNAAIELLNDSLGRSNSYSPSIGFTLLDESDNNKLLSFYKIPDYKYKSVFPNPDDSISYHKCTLETTDGIISSSSSPTSLPPSSTYNIKHHKSIDSSPLERTNLFKKSLSINSLSGKMYSFATISQLKSCLDEIIKQITSAREEFRLRINFGREVFTKIIKPVLTISEWNQLKRGHEGITTAFCHDVGFFEDEKRIEMLKKLFGFKEIDNDKEKCSVTVLYTEKNKKNKFKLQWNANEERWEIMKCSKNIRRQAIIDIVSGKNESPDLRFLMKSQENHPINQKYHNMFNNIQKSEDFLKRARNRKELFVNDEDKMYFRQDDFNGKLKCTSVRQTIFKKQLINDNFQINFISTLQDENKSISLEDSVSLINRSWVSSEKDHNCEFVTNPKFSEKITETIDCARKISREIGKFDYR